MIQDIKDQDEVKFVRNWAQRSYDQLQLVQITIMQELLADYARSAWRSAKLIEPPMDVVLICACEEGLVLMAQNDNGWRTTLGTPHKPPRAWMPAPVLPKE